MGMRHGTLHDSDNITAGGWSRGGDGFGKGKRTLVRTKDSFTKPAPVTVSHLPKQRQGNPLTDTSDGDNDAGAGAEASATATEPVDLLGLGSQEVQSSSYASVLLDSAVPTPTKVRRGVVTASLPELMLTHSHLLCCWCCFTLD